jgi:hypothetical protein
MDAIFKQISASDRRRPDDSAASSRPTIEAINRV